MGERIHSIGRAMEPAPPEAKLAAVVWCPSFEPCSNACCARLRRGAAEALPRGADAVHGGRVAGHNGKEVPPETRSRPRPRRCPSGARPAGGCCRSGAGAVCAEAARWRLRGSGANGRRGGRARQALPRLLRHRDENGGKAQPGAFSKGSPSRGVCEWAAPSICEWAASEGDGSHSARVRCAAAACTSASGSAR